MIELLVVVAIIGLLASVIVTAVTKQNVKARDAKRLSDIKQVASAMEQYFTKNSSYPPDLASLVTDGDMASAPSAPLPGDPPCTAAQNTYTYTLINANAYTLTFCISDVVGSTAAGVHTLSQAGIN